MENVSVKEARKLVNIMDNDFLYDDADYKPKRVLVNPIVNPPQDRTYPPTDDIEVIDLDDPRGQIKPTTWHW